jgi:hypothetical protein
VLPLPADALECAEAQLDPHPQGVPAHSHACRLLIGME